MGPFISKQLIKRLVTSNPSPDYVGRVAAVFADNGTGVRGDLKAVVTAILMDPEARRGDDPAQAQPSDGKLKEPVLFITNLLRSMNGVSDGTVLSDRASDMKEPPFFSPTVFNFYHPDHVIDGTTLVGPEFEIFDTSTDIARINFVNTLVYGSVSSTTVVDLSGYAAGGKPGSTGDRRCGGDDAWPGLGQHAEHPGHHPYRNSRQHPPCQSGFLSDWKLIAVPGRTLKGRTAMAFSRRDFLKRTCCTAAAGFAAASFNQFGLVNALAQSAQDYKALVCVFLFGGNDSNNMIVP